VQEIAVLPGVGETISVRAAKAHLSGLLDWVAQGREVVVTPAALPKARLVPMSKGAERVVFTGRANT
jgi:prevent-host-death family protein